LAENYPKLPTRIVDEVRGENNGAELGIMVFTNLSETVIRTVRFDGKSNDEL